VTQWVEVGKVAGVHGVQGWVKIVSYTAPYTNILDYAPWYVQGAGVTGQPGEQGWQPLHELKTLVQGKTILAQLATTDSRETARRWVGAAIAVRREQLPALPDGEYYWTDLLGFQVVTVEGVSLGSIDHFIETGANDVMVVKGEHEVLVPYVKGDVVRDIDVQNRIIRVAWDPAF